ncbi:MAG TPA: 16S rRNA (cytosine(967)-C(5))-methyltransferase RsmB [Verrucomicrobiae bacterium]|nr:16S rRNA (cytosine(967)-C(5))-methyltransferase RsmB [Verrucomicrobiae bacterium]
MASASKKARTSAPLKTARALAVEILHAVETRKAFADFLLDRALRTNPLSPVDAGLLTQIVYGALRWRGRIDWMLGQSTRKPLEAMDRYLKNLLRVTLYQIFFLDKIPAYAAVNEGVELAKRYGGKNAAGFVNAVARRCLREKDRLMTADGGGDAVRRLAVAWSHPEWLVRKWLDYFGAAETAALLKADNEEAPLVLRANRLKIGRDALIEKLNAAGIDAVPASRAPEAVQLDRASGVERLPGFDEGLFFVQGEASQLIAYLLGPQPGERVWDASAAPGGKATHLAELMEDRGEIVATDISRRGVERLKDNIRRLGLRSIHPFVVDASAELTGELALPYDRILADIPCTGLGTLRSHPEAKWLRRETDIARLSRLQRGMLDRLSSHLKPGGTMVYSTCTLTREENEEVVEDFLRCHKDYLLEDAAEFLPERARGMARGNYFMALPHRDGTDGFFAARLRKRA